jgi:hypothetical protein
MNPTSRQIVRKEESTNSFVAPGNEQLSFEQLVKDVAEMRGRTERIPLNPRVRRNTEYPQTSETSVSEERPKKPEQVTLILTHLDGHQQKEILAGARVPELEDWEDMADRLWLKNEKSKHGRLVFVGMKDETGRPYLRKHEYSVCSKRCSKRNCFSVLGCLPNDII